MAFKEVLVCFVAVLFVSVIQAKSVSTSYRGEFSAERVSDGDSHWVRITYKLYKNGELDASKTKHKKYKLKTDSVEEIQKYLQQYKDLIKEQDANMAHAPQTSRSDSFSTKITYKTKLVNGKRKCILTSVTTKNGQPFSTNTKSVFLKTDDPSEINDIVQSFRTKMQANIKKNPNKGKPNKKKSPKKRTTKRKKKHHKKHNKNKTNSKVSAQVAFKTSTRGKWFLLEATCKLFMNGKLHKEFTRNYKSKREAKILAKKKRFSGKICK